MQYYNACVYFVKSIHTGQLILRKMSKITATRCQILMLKRTKLAFHWGSAPGICPRPTGGAYCAPQTHNCIEGAYL